MSTTPASSSPASSSIPVSGQPSGRACPLCKSAMEWRLNRKSGRYFHRCERAHCQGKIGAPRGKAIAKMFGQTQAPQQQPQEVAAPSVQAAPVIAPAIQAAEEGAVAAGIGGALWEALRPVVLAEIERRARVIAAEEMAKAPGGGATLIEWTVNGQAFARVEGVTHRALGEVLRRVKADQKNILLVGPAGSGKTHLAKSAAEALGTSVSYVSCTAGMPEWHLVGRGVPSLTTGETIYQPSEFVQAYENGGLVLLDEVDAADPNTLLIINAAISNGRLSLPSRTSNPVALRHPNFYLFAAGNTFGSGASRMYVGRNQLDISTLSRFACSVIETDYDRDMEAKLVTDARVLTAVWKIRDAVAENSLRRIVGTRELVAVAKLVASGETLDWALSAMTVGWTADERSRVGLA